jgi:hypothetical protein
MLARFDILTRRVLVHSKLRRCHSCSVLHGQHFYLPRMYPYGYEGSTLCCNYFLCRLSVQIRMIIFLFVSII